MRRHDGRHLHPRLFRARRLAAMPPSVTSPPTLRRVWLSPSPARAIPWVKRCKEGQSQAMGQNKGLSEGRKNPLFAGLSKRINRDCPNGLTLLPLLFCEPVFEQCEMPWMVVGRLAGIHPSARGSEATRAHTAIAQRPVRPPTTPHPSHRTRMPLPQTLRARPCRWSRLRLARS